MNVCTRMIHGLIRQTSQNGIKCRNLSRTPTARSMDGMGDKYSPTPFDRKVLVWTKMFKSESEIPKEVSFATMRKSRDLMRIRVNIGMALATVVGCIAVISYSRSKQGQGDNLQNRGLQWEASLREQGRQERLEKGDSST